LGEVLALIDLDFCYSNDGRHTAACRRSVGCVIIALQERKGSDSQLLERAQELDWIVATR
jgi:hypothetical protein